MARRLENLLPSGPGLRADLIIVAARYLGGGTRIVLLIRAAAAIDVLVQAQQASRAN